jgi:hypothetical protein
MSTILITFREPELLTAGEKLAEVVAEKAPLEAHDVFLPKPVHTIENIHLRAEAMTSLLEEILAIHPGPRWGINE